MYLNSIYNLNWNLLNLVGSRGAGKTYTAAHLIKQLAEKNVKCAICIDSELAQENLWYDYFRNYVWYRDSFVAPLNVNDINIYYPKTLPSEFMEQIVWFENPTEFTLSRLNSALLALSASYDNNPSRTTKMISTFSFTNNGKVDRLLKYPDVHNVFCYGGDYLAELLSGKLVANICEFIK